MNGQTPSARTVLAPTFGQDLIERWSAAQPGAFPSAEHATAEDFRRDWAATAAYFELGQDLLQRLPRKTQRSANEQAAADGVHAALLDTRLRLLRSYVGTIYAQLTDDYTRFVPAEELAYAAAAAYPGLTPTRAAVEEEWHCSLSDKEQIERDQALFLWQVLAHPRAGRHLVHALMRPREESFRHLEDFRRSGVADFGVMRVQREGKAGILTLANTRYLNAEDATTLTALETCIDLVLLDEQIEVGVLRGAQVTHPRYRDRRVFSAGLNLTHLYAGQIPFLFFVRRDVGVVNKLYRGLSPQAYYPHEPEDTLEKPWIAAVDTFAIGGGCQLLLVVDKVIAETQAYFSLPARKEGIIPGTANLRLPRIVGDRLARQGIQFDAVFTADSPEGRLLCDEVVASADMDAAIAHAIEEMTASGVVSFAGNRKALRVGQEPLPVFQQYAATFVKELAECYFSPSLIRNLEQHWKSRKRSSNEA